MSSTSKIMTQKDADQALRGAFNDVNATLSIDGFLAAQVGRKITQTITTTTVSGDTAVFGFYENSGATHLLDYTLIFTDGTQTVLLSAERTF